MLRELEQEHLTFTDDLLSAAVQGAQEVFYASKHKNRSLLIPQEPA